jgi:hypothetical protein
LRYTIVTPLAKLKKGKIPPAEGTLTSDPCPEPAGATATSTTTTTTTSTATAPGPARLAVVLAFAAGLASLAVAAGYSHPTESSVTASRSMLDCAREAMMHGHHADALGYFLHVPSPSPEELFHIAECQFRTNDFEAALETCCRIDFETGGTDWSAPLVRGWIAERRGHKILAVTWYTQSAERGNPGAKKLAERVK